MDRYAYNAPDEFRPKRWPDLIKVASRPYVGLTAFVAGRPHLVIAFDGQEYTLEDTRGETIQLSDFFWDDENLSEENSLVAASRIEGSPFEPGMEVDGQVIGKLAYDDQSGEWSVESDGSQLDLITLIETLEAQGWEIEEEVELDPAGTVRRVLDSDKAASFFSCADCEEEECDPDYCNCGCHEEDEEEEEEELPEIEAAADEADLGSKKILKCPHCKSHTVRPIKLHKDKASEFFCHNCGENFNHDVTVTSRFDDEHLPENLHRRDPAGDDFPTDDGRPDPIDRGITPPGSPGDAIPEFDRHEHGGGESELGFITEQHGGEPLVIEEVTEDFGDSKIVRAADGREYMVTPDGAVSFHGRRVGEVTDPRLLFGEQGPATDVLDPADGPSPAEQEKLDRELEADDTKHEEEATGADEAEADASGDQGPYRRSSFDKTTDTDGHPLREGWYYSMHSTKYRLPDAIHVVQITPDLLIATTHEGSVTLKIKASDLVSEGYSFEPLVVENADKKIESHFLVTSRRKFSPSQQRAFIDEEGKARNSDKLNLDGTHYGQDDSNEDDELSIFFLW